jgi:hypothetical protein
MRQSLPTARDLELDAAGAIAGHDGHRADREEERRAPRRSHAVAVVVVLTATLGEARLIPTDTHHGCVFAQSAMSSFIQHHTDTIVIEIADCAAVSARDRLRSSKERGKCALLDHFFRFVDTSRCGEFSKLVVAINDEARYPRAGWDSSRSCGAM